MDREKLEVASEERRNFLKLAGTGSFTAAVVAGAGGMLWSGQAAAQTAREEREREAAADHVMTLATAYVLGASRSYPIMQLDLKENIQNATNGKVYVKLAPGGQLGAGGALAQAVQTGTIQCAQHSLSNFAPYASAVDLINMPYFCGSNQRFTNLVTSDAWKGEVHPKVEASGFKALFYIVIDPRVVAVRKGGNKVITPGDLDGVKFRVPGSKFRRIPRDELLRFMRTNDIPTSLLESGPKRVLVVDDDPKILELIEDLLSGDGDYEVKTASTGYDAGLLTESFKPHLIVLDYMLPDINGLELVSFVKNNDRYSRIPLVIVSTEGSERDRDKGLGLGADAYLVKPFDPEALRQLAHELLARQREAL